MITLGINTASENTEIKLVKDNEILKEDTWKAENNESEKLLPALKELLNKADLDWEDINKIAVVRGPGPFTALRVGVATANAIAYGLNIPIIGIESDHDFDWLKLDEFKEQQVVKPKYNAPPKITISPKPYK